MQARRPSPFELVPQLEKMTVPTLIIHGDEDRPCLGTGALLKRTIPSAGLMVFPKTGHTINLEEPALFNQALQDFFTQVESGRWLLRDKRTETRGGAAGYEAVSLGVNSRRGRQDVFMICGRDRARIARLPAARLRPWR